MSSLTRIACLPLVLVIKITLVVIFAVACIGSIYQSVVKS